MDGGTLKRAGARSKGKLLGILRERGPTSRVELSRLMNLSPAAITHSTAQMLARGVIRECGTERSDIGRKPVLMELRSDFCYVCGADIVGGAVKAALADLSGGIVAYAEQPVRRGEGARAVLNQLAAVLRQAVAKAGVPRESIWAVVAGTPGLFDAAAGKSRFASFLDGWEQLDVRARLADEFSAETLVENDVNLDVIGESWKGAGKNYADIFYVKLGQGLAARTVLQNRLLRGRHGMAGEMGYLPPGFTHKPAHGYENLLCNHALAERYRGAGGAKAAACLTEIRALARGGDGAARQTVDYLLKQLAVLLACGASVLDPQVIILGGDACCLDEGDIAALSRHMERFFPLRQNIITAALKKDACLYGALKTGLDMAAGRIVAAGREV